MTLHRYQPWGLHQQLWNEVNKLFDNASSSDASSAATADWAPAVDIEEHADKFVLFADVPGVDPATIEVTLEKGVLSLTGSRAARVEQKEVQSRREERVSGRFFRRFSLPDTVDSESVKASNKNGVLEIVIPKRPASQPRRITVTH